jgi:hypothetical protein
MLGIAYSRTQQLRVMASFQLQAYYDRIMKSGKHSVAVNNDCFSIQAICEQATGEGPDQSGSKKQPSQNPHCQESDGLWREDAL